MTRRALLSALELKMSPVMMTTLLAVLMWFLARIVPGYSMAPGLRLAALLVFLCAGAAIGIAGVRAFHRARTTVNPWRPHATSALVTTGIYRRTRNPMYLALLLALAGWGLFLANLYSLLLGFMFVPYMNRFQIRPEERALEQAYGEAFVEYCRQVRRWF
jgi:protein-S-isoprenylcysteine O-methyltransferase Ste14